MHDPCARSRCLQKRTTQKHLTGGTGVEPAKHPPKVKSEIFLQLQSAREELVTRTSLCEEDVGAFYSSEAFAPFLVVQVFSLQDQSYSCRASLLLVAQVLSLQSKSSSCRASLLLVGQVFSLQSKSCPCGPSPFLAQQVFKNLKRGGQVWALVLSGAPHKEWAWPFIGPWTWACWARQALYHILSSSIYIYC